MIYALLAGMITALLYGLFHFIKKSAALEVDNEVLRKERDILHHQVAIAARPPASPSELIAGMLNDKL